MPPKRVGSAARAASAGSAATSSGRVGSAKQGKKKKAAINAAPLELPPPTMEEIINNVAIPKPFAGVVSDKGSAVYSIAVAEGLMAAASSSSSAAAADVVTTPNAASAAASQGQGNAQRQSRTRLVFTGSHNGVITVSHCYEQPTTAAAGGSSQRGGGGLPNAANNMNSNGYNSGGGGFGGEHYEGSSAFDAAAAPSSSSAGGATLVGPNGVLMRGPFDSTEAAAAAGYGSTRVLPKEDNPAPLFSTKTQSLPAHKNIIKQLAVVEDLPRVLGKSIVTAASPAISENLKKIVPQAVLSSSPSMAGNHQQQQHGSGGDHNNATLANSSASIASKMLFSCSVDGTIKLWSLPECTLKAVYTTASNEAFNAKARAAEQRGPITLADRARVALGDAVSKTTTFLTGVPADLEQELREKQLEEAREKALRRKNKKAAGGKGGDAHDDDEDDDDAIGHLSNTNTDANDLLSNVTPRRSTLNAMCFGPEGSNRLYAVDDEGYVHSWEIVPTTGKLSAASAALSSASDPSNNVNSTGAAANAPTIFPLSSLKVHKGRITAVTTPIIDSLLFPNGPHAIAGAADPPKPTASCVVTVSDEGMGKLVDLDQKKVLSIYVCEATGEDQYAPTEPCTSVAYRHPNVIIGCMDGTIQVFDAMTANRVARWHGHSDSVNRLVLTKPFVVGQTTPVPPPPVIRVLSKKQLQKLAMQGKAPPPPPAPQVHQQLPAEGHLLISCSDDRSIALWDCTNWTPIFYFSTPSASLSRFRRPMSAKFEPSTSSAAAAPSPFVAAAGGVPPSSPFGVSGDAPFSPFSPQQLNSQSANIYGAGANNTLSRTAFNHQDYSSALNATVMATNGFGPSSSGGNAAAPLHHKHSISDICVDEKALSHFALSLLNATNAANNAITTIVGLSSKTTQPMPLHLTPVLSASGSTEGFASEVITSAHNNTTPLGSNTVGGGLLFSTCFGGKVLAWNFFAIVAALDQRQRIQYNCDAVAKAKARSEAIAEKNKQNQKGGSGSKK